MEKEKNYDEIIKILRSAYYSALRLAEIGEINKYSKILKADEKKHNGVKFEKKVSNELKLASERLVSHSELCYEVFDGNIFSEEAKDYIRNLSCFPKTYDSQAKIKDILVSINKQIYSVSMTKAREQKIAEQEKSEKKQSEPVSKTTNPQSTMSQNEFQKNTYQKPKTQEEMELEKLQEIETKFEKANEKLSNGPKKKLLFGKDKAYKDMEYLYGLSLDILVLLESERTVLIEHKKYEEKNIYNLDDYSNGVLKSTYVDAIYKKYGVKNLDELIRKYDTIRQKYYKHYEKLNDKEKRKYSLTNSDFPFFKSGLASQQLSERMKNKNYSFPPTSAEMISIINTRILNFSNLKEGVATYTGKEINSIDYDRYRQAEKYYRNLCSRLDIEQVYKLFERKTSQMYLEHSYGRLDDFLVVENEQINKIFCAIVLDKMKAKDIKPEQCSPEIIQFLEKNNAIETKKDTSSFEQPKQDNPEMQKKPNLHVAFLKAKRNGYNGSFKDFNEAYNNYEKLEQNEILNDEIGVDEYATGGKRK